ncbi:MAG: hypothetical protein IKP64_13495, partial [Selenomonadaceae bacterium]|nr:hypothetical protein [Selenomonadaceae bacterium]
ELILPALGGDGLKRLLDEREFIWREKDFLNVNRLWENFAKFYYMPRLVDVNVLFDAIRRAVKNEIFALADDENFSNLQFGEVSASVSGEKFLVKASKAREIIAAEKKSGETESETIEREIFEPPEDIQPPTPEEEPLPTKFVMDTVLDNIRLRNHFKKYDEEVISHLMTLPNAQVEIRLSVKVSMPDGIPKDTCDTVESNCRDMKAEYFQFER